MDGQKMLEEGAVTISAKLFADLIVDHSFVAMLHRKMAAQRIEDRNKEVFETILVREEEMPDAWCL